MGKTVEKDWLAEYELTSMQKRFLAAYAIAATATAASRASKVSTKSHYHWMKLEGPEGDRYREAAEEAKSRGNDALISEARERAMQGVKTAKWFEGRIVGYEWVKDTTLLIFLMKGAMPQIYRDNVKIDGQVGPTLEQIVAAANKFTLVPPAGKEQTA